jgi:hypothetical protein
LAALVVGLHVYLFCLWMIPSWPPEEYWQGYYVDLSAIGTIRPVITEKPLLEEETEPVPASEPGPSDAAGDELPETGPTVPPPPVPPPPPEPEPLAIYATPLSIALGSVLAFFILLECLRATAAAPGPSRSQAPSST